MASLVDGQSHVCGLTATGFLVCKGNNDSGQLNVPFSPAFEFTRLALGENFSCAIRGRNGLVVCWGGINRFIANVSFESIVAGIDFVCGLTTMNLSVICWTSPMGVGEYASPHIWTGDLKTVFDRRVGLPKTNEAEAVELMANTALHGVNLEEKKRPNVTDIVANLERSLTLFEDSQASFSTNSL
ncbi:hypothetical protein CFOL_v3_30863 [Cephalotus follicularis]|uniref:RCC1 domain-containing protein n=1 Tax=Cephalotus follicularis TaxID=3775 RepID=A0A1Q3D4K8_CEPFO|nr:hypothetical protein CFOL_v3_30863 [Cephalotus follicularis]